MAHFPHGQAPVLVIVSGSGQTGSPGGFLSAPLIVSVSDTNGNPLYDAPVTFTVTSGTGRVQASSTGTAVGALTTVADASGQAQAFFQLPAALSSASQITVTTGTGGASAQVTFAEFSDNGAGSYGSPFAPSNVVGSMNGDGSEAITWQNNDSVSPIYVYELQSSGTWTVLATLSSGTSAYTASASTVGSVEIGNNYSPGGSTGGGSGGGSTPGAGGGGGGGGTYNPGEPPFVPIPAQSYAAIDMSGSTTNIAVAMVALDDSNNTAFAFPTGTGTATQLNVYTWSNGNPALNQTLNLTGQETVSAPSGEFSGSVTLTYGPAFLLSSGLVYGGRGGYADDDPTEPGVPDDDFPIDDGGFSATGGSASDIDIPAPYEIDQPESGVWSMSINGVSNIGYVGGSPSYPYPGYPGIGYVYQAGVYTVFDSGTDNTSNAQVHIWQGVGFIPCNLNNKGWAYGYDNASNAEVLTGTGGSMRCS